MAISQSIRIVTLFPELFQTFVKTSFVGRAIDAGILDVRFEELRAYGVGKHQSVDDSPYGGGSGMVMRVDCLVAALESIDAREGLPYHRVLLTPQGKPFCQTLAYELAVTPRLALVCGRYEGFDERVRSFVHQEISMGDFVLTGGEVPAMAIVEACVRLLPGVLGNEDSTTEESFSKAHEGLLEYAQYTRPAEFRGMGVPDVLKSGDHAKVAQHRRQQSLERTALRRPDLLPGKARNT